jgi:hypothetical protein
MNAQPSAEFLDSVSDLMHETRTYLEKLRSHPREGRTDSILLGLLSKSIVLTEAILVLVLQRFNDEAFGLCRSCVEIHWAGQRGDQRCRMLGFASFVI